MARRFLDPVEPTRWVVMGAKPVRPFLQLAGGEEKGAVTREQAAASGARRVLIVEDDPAVMAFLDALLVDRGYQVVQARNGVEAMVSLTSGDSEFPHAVLLDIGLPLEGGVSVLSFLRNVLRSGLPVIVVTGRQDAEEEATLRRLGISAFLRKPPSADQVLSALTRALA